jgi:anti-sigma factor RsiW
MNAHATDEQLIDYLHGELAPADDALLHAHLAACAPCRARADEEAAIGDWLRANLLEVEFPALVKARVWEAIRAERPGVLDRLRAFLRPVVLVPLAAVLALSAYVSVPVLRLGTPPAAVAATYYLDEHQAESQENPLTERSPANFTAPTAAPASAPLIDQADAATLDTPLADS